jgi:4-hydroxy-tetrahydrodipicolinate synthase
MFSAQTGQALLDPGGLYAYLVTPYAADGTVDAGVLGEYASRIADAGVTGVTCIASTCEGPYLTDEERDTVVSTVGRVVAGRLQFNVGIGALSTRQTIEYAKRAEGAGATCLMLEMRQYFPVTFDAAFEHYQAVADAVGVPIRLYNLPGPTGFDFTPDRVHAMTAIGSIKSVKEASGDVARVRDIRMLCGDRLSVFCGLHFQALDGFRLGAAGWEVMMHPLIATDLVLLYRALREDPWSTTAERMYRRLQPLFYCFRQYGVPQCIKAMSEKSDLPLGRPRAPLRSLEPVPAGRLTDILANLQHDELAR